MGSVLYRCWVGSIFDLINIAFLWPNPWWWRRENIPIYSIYIRTVHRLYINMNNPLIFFFWWICQELQWCKALILYSDKMISISTMRKHSWLVWYQVYEANACKIWILANIITYSRTWINRENKKNFLFGFFIVSGRNTQPCRT